MLTVSEKKKLKSLAHHLKPIVQIGKRGFSDTLLKEVEAALLAHELIKVKIHESAHDAQEAILKSIGQGTEAEVIEMKGHVATLYRRHPDNPQIL